MSSSNDSKPDNYQVNAKICRQVSPYPCMYDRSHQFYLKKDVVDRAWTKIAKEMDDSIPSCKERWRNIRTSFARSINVNKIPASANRTKPYYLHEELQFLARHITPGIPVSRRSNNAYYSAGEESEVIEVSVGEESFDGFVNMVANGVDDEADSEDDQQSSDAVDEVPNEMGIVKTEQQLMKLATPTPVVMVATPPLPPVMERYDKEEADDEEKEIDEAEHKTEVEVPVVPASVVPVHVVVTPIICPPKKRQRMEEEVVSPTPESEPERDIKPMVDPTSNTDFDSVFLQNLLPEVKAMDFRQKLIFKRRIYEVIGEIFETPPELATSQIAANKLAPTLPPPTPSFAYAASAPTLPATLSTMTVVNAADLAMIRRLNNLLQSPTGSVAASSTTVTAVPKNIASISSTVRSSALPATATVAMHRGALTRSTTNLLRVTMVNAPSSSSMPSSSPSSSNAQCGPHVVKLERDDLDLMNMVD